MLASNGDWGGDDLVAGEERRGRGALRSESASEVGLSAGFNSRSTGRELKSLGET